METTKPLVPVMPKKKRRWARVFKWFCITLLALSAGLAYAVKDYVRTLNSLRRVPNTNLYVMDYYADYHLGEVRTDGMDVKNIEDSFLRVFLPDIVLPIATRVKQYYVPNRLETIESTRQLCSSGVLKTKHGEAIFGYNCDYNNDAALIVQVWRANGARSVAALDLAYLNLNRADLDQTSLLTRLPLLFSPYYLLSGMNEHGVAVCSLSLAESRAPHDPAKRDLLLNTAMRVIIDDAHTVDEAIEILGKYNLHFVETPCHLLIADAKGQSAVVEFLDGQIRATPGGPEWQVCTNHRIWARSEEEDDRECDRYRKVSDRLETFEKSSPVDCVMDAMQSVSQKNWTMWTTVFDLSSTDFRVVYKQQLGEQYQGRLRSR